MAAVNEPPVQNVSVKDLTDLEGKLLAARTTIHPSPDSTYMVVLTFFTPEGDSMASIFTSYQPEGIADALEETSEHIVEHLALLRRTLSEDR